MGWFTSREWRGGGRAQYLIEIDDRLPEVVSLLVEIPHPHLPKVSWMVLVHVRSVVVLTASETSSTGVLAVLAYTTVSGRDMAATVGGDVSDCSFFSPPFFNTITHPKHEDAKTATRR